MEMAKSPKLATEIPRTNSPQRRREQSRFEKNQKIRHKGTKATKFFSF